MRSSSELSEHNKSKSYRSKASPSHSNPEPNHTAQDGTFFSKLSGHIAIATFFPFYGPAREIPYGRRQAKIKKGIQSGAGEYKLKGKEFHTVEKSHLSRVKMMHSILEKAQIADQRLKGRETDEERGTPLRIDLPSKKQPAHVIYKYSESVYTEDGETARNALEEALDACKTFFETDSEGKEWIKNYPCLIKLMNKGRAGSPFSH